MQPLAPAFDGAQTNLTDNTHGTGGEGEKAEQIRQVNPLLKGTECSVLIRERAEPNHRADYDRGTIGAEIRQHQSMLAQGVMNAVHARAALRDHILQSRIDFKDF